MKSFLLTYFCIWFFAIIMQMLLWLKIPGYHWDQVKTICGNITPGTNIDLLQNITVNFIPRKRVQRPICCCCCQVTSVVSDSVRPHRWQATRLPRPWDSPGKNTGVGCHFLLQGMKVKRESEVAQSCPTPSDPMDCSLPGSSVHGIFQARILEWVAISFSSAWKWKVKVKSLSLTAGFSRQEY